MSRHIFLAVVLACVQFQWGTPSVHSQETKSTVVQLAATQKPFKRLTLSVAAGFWNQMSKAGIREFWDGGAAASVSLMVSVDRTVALGVGVDAALLTFNEDSFKTTHPGIPVQAANTVFLNAYIAWKYTPFWKYRLAPYFGASVGAARYTGAEYKQIVNDVKVTYYEIPGITRLSLSAMAGLEFILVRWAVLTVEAKATYVHHDQEAGVGIGLIGGFRFIL